MYNPKIISLILNVEDVNEIKRTLVEFIKQLKHHDYLHTPSGISETSGTGVASVARYPFGESIDRLLKNAINYLDGEEADKFLYIISETIDFKYEVKKLIGRAVNKGFVVITFNPSEDLLINMIKKYQEENGNDN